MNFSVDIDFCSVDLDISAGTQIDHHVPVQAALIVVAGFGISGSEREVDGAADLFVEEGVAGVLRNAVVGADSAFTEESAAGVGVEHREKKILTLAGRGVDDISVAERQLRVGHFVAMMNGGETEVDLAFYAVDDRAG